MPSKPNRSTAKTTSWAASGTVVKLSWDAREYDVRGIDETHFVFECDPLVRAHDPNQTGPVLSGTLRSNSVSDTEVMFRVVGTHDRLVRCQFYEPTSTVSDQVHELISAAQQTVPAPKMLKHPDTPPPRQAIRPTEFAGQSLPPAQSHSRGHSGRRDAARPTGIPRPLWKLLAGGAVCLCLGWLLTAGSPDVPVAKSVVSDNSMTVYIPAAGDVVSVLVAEGDIVKEGDVLATIATGLDRERLKPINDEIVSLQADEVQQRARAVEYAGLMKSAKRQATEELDATNSAMTKTETLLQDARSLLKSLAPLIEAENIAANEVAEIKQRIATLETSKQEQSKKIDTLTKAVSNLTFNLENENSATPLGRVRVEIQSTSARIKQLQSQLDAIAKDSEIVNVAAPQEGSVKSLHLTRGQLIDAADPAFSLTNGNQAWAVGVVSPERFDDVEPGRKVNARLISSDTELSGTVVAVGHARRVIPGSYPDYSPTSIVVQVRLDPIQQPLVPGEPIEMSIPMNGTMDRFGNWVESILGSRP